MLNRRLIRIKVFQALFGHFKDENPKIDQITKACRSSILGIEQNFLTVISFLTELRQFIVAEKNPEELKFKANEDDKLTYALMAENSFIDQIDKHPAVKSYLKAPKVEWTSQKDLMALIYKEIRKKPEFHSLKSIEDVDRRSFELAVLVYKSLIMESVDFEHFMEEQVIVWYDEKIPILKNLDRMFERYEKEGKIIMPSLSKDIDEDLEFADLLIASFYENFSELEETLNSYTPGWDSDRIMKIDYVLMCMALCEFKYLPFVPVKVTINEYIEVAKMYSTPQSSKFINGTLDKILKDWQQAGSINKSGRGLIG